MARKSNSSVPTWLRKYDLLAAQRISAFKRALVRIVRFRLEPLSFQSVTEWAEANRYLPPTASEPGRYRADRCPYQRGIQDAFTIPGVKEITVQAAERVGKSTIASNILGFIIDRRPAGILWVLPSMLSMADFVRDEVDPMIQQSVRLRRKVAGRATRDGSNSVRRKSFQNGTLTLVGGGSSTNLAIRTVKYVIADEIDKLKNLPGEGDADTLLAKRISTFTADGMVLRFSKPTTEDRSRINRHFYKGTQSKWFLLCPNPECGQYVHLRWQHVHFDDARAYCEHCHQGFDQDTWLSSPGEWRETVENLRHKSFQVSALVSPFIRWEELVTEFQLANEALEAGDPSLMMVFQNSRLGEASGGFGAFRLEATTLYDRRTYFGQAEVPPDIVGVTLGIDTQSDSFKWLAVGWGRRNEVWLLETGTIGGDMASAGPWTELTALLDRLWYDAEGNAYRSLMSCLDVQGDHYERCVQFVGRNAHRRLRGVRGLGADKRKSIGQKTNIVRNEYKDKVLKVPIRNLDVDAAKTMLATMLGKTEPAGPGIIHLPCGPAGEDTRGFDLVTVSEFTAEYRRKKMIEGYTTFVWCKFGHLDNHRLDCAVYALGAKLLTRLDFDNIAPVRIKAEQVAEYKQRLKEPVIRQRRRVPSPWGPSGLSNF
jgi:phage terminase large subunit GpA-like protein